jgi:hypothetical protein
MAILVHSLHSHQLLLVAVAAIMATVATVVVLGAVVEASPHLHRRAVLAHLGKGIPEEMGRHHLRILQVEAVDHLLSGAQVQVQHLVQVEPELQTVSQVHQ